MLTLAIDTASAACQACIHDSGTDRVLGQACEVIGRGHAERLMPVIDAALDAAAVDLSAIGRIAVTTGPGSFTGIRVGVSAARGLALALGCECVGVCSLEALAARCATADPVLAVIDARREEVYAALFAAGMQTLVPPASMSARAAADLAAPAGVRLTGSGAPLVAELLPAARRSERILSASDTVDMGGSPALPPRGPVRSTARGRFICAAPTPGRRRISPSHGRPDMSMISRFFARELEFEIFDMSDEDTHEAAALHSGRFRRAWSDEEIHALLVQEPVFGFVARRTNAARALSGFVLARAAAGEAEILTIAVQPRHARRGLGWRLMRAALREAHSRGAAAMFLEVDETNAPATALYRRLGFRRSPSAGLLRGGSRHEVGGARHAARSRALQAGTDRMTPIVAIRIALALLVVLLWTLLLLPVQVIGIWLKLPVRSPPAPLVASRRLPAARDPRPRAWRARRRPPLLLASNHESWKDIMVLGSVADVAFIAKSEVRTGRSSACSPGCSARSSSSASRSATTGAQISDDRRPPGRRRVVVLFAEGTTSDGNRCCRSRRRCSARHAALAARAPEGEVHRPAGRRSPIPACTACRWAAIIGRSPPGPATWRWVPHLLGVLQGGSDRCRRHLRRADRFHRRHDRKARRRAMRGRRAAPC